MKIAFAVLSHADYQDRLMQDITSLAIDSLEKAGIEIHRSEPLVTQRSAIDWSVRTLGDDVDGVILFLASWVDCSVVMTIVQEMACLPMLLWGFPMMEMEGVRQSTGSYVSLAMIQGVLDRIGRTCSRLLGVPGDPCATEQVLRFGCVASAIKQMRRSRVGLVGYSAMSIYPGTFDHVLMRTRIGPEVVHIDSYTIINKARNLADGSIRAQEDWIRSTTEIADDVSDGDLSTAAAITLSLLRTCEEMDLDGINVKCQVEFSKEFGAVACVPICSLPEFGIVGACEGDMLCTVSMLLLNKLSGQSTGYGDAIDHSGDVLTLSACGFMPFSFADRERRLIRKFMPHPGFKGIQGSFVGRPGKVTMLRMIEDVGAYHALVFTGDVLPGSLPRQGYMPAVEVRIDGSMDELFMQFNGQHYAYAYGDWSREILEYCRLCGIRTVYVQ
jgi:L-fucose isomerase-like protein